MIIIFFYVVYSVGNIVEHKTWLQPNNINIWILRREVAAKQKLFQTLDFDMIYLLGEPNTTDQLR